MGRQVVRFSEKSPSCHPILRLKSSYSTLKLHLGLDGSAFFTKLLPCGELSIFLTNFVLALLLTTGPASSVTDFARTRTQINNPFSISLGHQKKKQRSKMTLGDDDPTTQDIRNSHK
jgi:hypothetical protein